MTQKTLTLIDGDADALTPEETSALEARARASITVSFDDHGLTWERAGGREWARGVSGCSLWIAPNDGILDVEGSGAGGGFGFMVVSDDAMEIVRTGTAPTRAEARKHAVFALGQHLGLKLTPDEKDLAEAPVAQADAAERFPFWLRVGAGAVVVAAVTFGIAVLVGFIVEGAR